MFLFLIRVDGLEVACFTFYTCILDLKYDVFSLIYLPYLLFWRPDLFSTCNPITCSRFIAQISNSSLFFIITSKIQSNVFRYLILNNWTSYFLWLPRFFSIPRIVIHLISSLSSSKPLKYIVFILQILI